MNTPEYLIEESGNPEFWAEKRKVNQESEQ